MWEQEGLIWADSSEAVYCYDGSTLDFFRGKEVRTFDAVFGNMQTHL
jgi:hypothetical protein